MRITKDIFYIVPSLLLAGLTLLSCHRKEPVQPEKEPSIIEFTDGSSENILFGLDGGSQTISFKTNYVWSASFASEPAGGWCSISPAEGPAGSNSIKVTTSGNASPDERTASFKIRSGDVEKTVTVTQKPSDAIAIASTRIEFNPEGGTRLITAMSGYPCQASVSEDARSWINILSVRAVTTEVSISVTRNESVDNRRGVVTITNEEGGVEEVVVFQTGVQPVLTLSSKQVDMPAAGGEFEVTVTTNVDVEVSVPAGSSWVREDKSRADVQNEYHFIVDPNGSTQQRSATITFANTEKGLSQSLTVNQKGAREEGSIHILAIGNSFSVDAMEYLCQILLQAGYKSVKLGNLYIGGCTLKTHAENIANNFKAYTYYTTTTGTWSSVSSYSSVDAIRSESWDYISMQQASGVSGMPDSYEPHLGTLVSTVRKLAPEATMMWHMTWAYQSTSTHSEFPNYGNDQMRMYNAIVSTVKSKVLTKPEFKFVIPSGTAIQNLRTSLYGDTLTRDGYHLSYGVGRFAAALMWAKQISGCDLSRITWHPSSYSYTENQIGAIKEAVENAYAHPFEVTQSTFREDSVDPDAGLVDILRANGYDPGNYYALNLGVTTVAYYNSSTGNANLSTNMRAYAATRLFQKTEIPNGSIIVQKSGYQYRPEGWTALNQKTNPRPDVVQDQIVVVDDAWWGNYNYRGFNLSKAGAPSLSDAEQAQLEKSFGIFVPR